MFEKATTNSGTLTTRIQARFLLLRALFSLLDGPAEVVKVLWYFALHSVGIDRSFVVHIQGRPMCFPTVRELFTAKQILLDGMYDVDIADPRIVVDLGANIGMASVFFARKYPRAVVEAYEPDPQTFRYLLQNTQGLNVRCHQRALSAHGGLVKFYHSPLSLASSLFAAADTQEIEVESIRVADLPKADVVKIDIEGAEEFLSETDFPAAKVIVGEGPDRDMIDKRFPSAVWRKKDIFLCRKS